MTRGDCRRAPRATVFALLAKSGSGAARQARSAWRAAVSPFALLALTLALLAAAPAARAAASYSDAEVRSLESSDEAKVRGIRDQEVQQLQLALGRRLPGNRRADLYVRLAETYLEAYRAEFLLEGRAHESRIEKGQSPRTIDRSRSRVILRKGIDACQQIVRLNIPYPKLDQVYYFLGFYYGELEDRAASLKHFDLLARKYPYSPFVGDAYREMGDDAFGKAEYRRALGYYELAAKRASGESIPRVLHKLAWSYYRTKQYDRAIVTMKQAIQVARKSGDKFLSLREEALRDMAIFMTEGGRVDEAIQYFQEVAGDRDFYPRALERLGKMYERNVEPEKATVVYESLLKTNQDSEASIRVAVKLVELDLKRGRTRQALERLARMKIPSDPDEADTKTALGNLRAMVRKTGTEAHERFRKKAERAALPVAEGFYEAYLKTFLAKDDPRKESPEIKMYLAEIKRELGKSREASELYREIVRGKEPRFAKEAGALWTASLSEAIKRASGQRPPGVDLKEPSELEREFVEATDQLREALGDTPDGREAEVRAAQVLAGYPATRKEGLKRADRLIERAPRTSTAVTAARLKLQLRTESLAGVVSHPTPEQADRIEDVQKLLAELRANADLMAADAQAGGKLAASVRDWETRLRIGTIAVQEKSSQFGEAAAGYESFARDTADREVAEKAYANAVGAYLKSRDFAGVGRVVATWRARYKGSPKASESARLAATQALILGEFGGAASLFEGLGADGRDADALETAARVHEGLGDGGRAQKAWADYLRVYSDRPGRFGVALQLARAQDAAKLDVEASKAYRYCASGGDAYEAECLSRLGDIFLRNQDRVEARKLYRKVADQSTARGKAARTGVSAWVGYARFRLAGLMESEAKFTAFGSTEASIRQGVQERLKFLEPLSRAYKAAVEAGGPWGVAALDRLARFAWTFGADLSGVQPPAGASPAAAAGFKKSIAGVAEPLKKRARATWLDGYAQAVAGEVLSPVIPEMADRMADLGVRNPARAQGARAKFRLAGLPADGGPEGRETGLRKTRERLLKDVRDAGAWIDYGNLLWGENKPLLAKVAYDFSLTLNAKSAAALNNRGVVGVMGAPGTASAQEDWLAAAGANALFVQALAAEPLFVAAKFNRASLLTYFRVFAKAKPLWEQTVVKSDTPDAQDGLGTAAAGLGQAEFAEAAFRKAEALGASGSRFAARFHAAAKLAGANQPCRDAAARVPSDGLQGFEAESRARLYGSCGGD